MTVQTNKVAICHWGSQRKLQYAAVELASRLYRFPFSESYWHAFKNGSWRMIFYKLKKHYIDFSDKNMVIILEPKYTCMPSFNFGHFVVAEQWRGKNGHTLTYQISPFDATRTSASANEQFRMYKLLTT